jgi:hypothetical protein
VQTLVIRFYNWRTYTGASVKRSVTGAKKTRASLLTGEVARVYVSLKTDQCLSGTSHASLRLAPVVIDCQYCFLLHQKTLLLPTKYLFFNYINPSGN